jgi:hypothetical protein
VTRKIGRDVDPTVLVAAGVACYFAGLYLVWAGYEARGAKRPIAVRLVMSASAAL